MIRIQSVSILLLLTFGIIHIIFGALTSQQLSMDDMWFAGSGLYLVTLSCINWIFTRMNNSKMLYTIVQLNNFIFVLFMTLIISIEFSVPGVLGLVCILICAAGNHWIYKYALTN